MTIFTITQNNLKRNSKYKKLFEFDGIELEFEPDALEAIADEALVRGTGARGLRAIIEQKMLNVMYDLPSKSNVKKCVVTKKMIKENEPPILVYSEDAGAKSDSESRTDAKKSADSA